MWTVNGTTDVFGTRRKQARCSASSSIDGAEAAQAATEAPIRSYGKRCRGAPTDVTFVFVLYRQSNYSSGHESVIESEGDSNT